MRNLRLLTTNLSGSGGVHIIPGLRSDCIEEKGSDYSKMLFKVCGVSNNRDLLSISGRLPRAMTTAFIVFSGNVLDNS